MGAPTDAGTISPERYLRLLLEDELAGEGPADRMAGALAALTGTGALDPVTAAEVGGDANSALILRGRPALASFPAPAGPGAGGSGRRAAAHGQPAGERWLWHLITLRLAHLLVDGTADRSGDAGPAVAALAACGVLPARDPTAAQARLLDDVALGLGDEEQLAPRIRSVLDARDHLGRTGRWAIGGSPVVVDGVGVTVLEVEATDAILSVTAICDPGPWPTGVDLTAADDRGGWYVGHRWTDGAGDPWTVVPSLDPEATELRLVVTGPTEVAAWTVGL